MKLKKKYEPANNEIREVSGFALFPARIDVETRVWLQKYTRKEIFNDWRHGSDGWQIYDTEKNMVWNVWLRRWLHKDLNPLREPQPRRKIMRPKVQIKRLNIKKNLTISDRDSSKPKSGGRYGFMEKEMK